jgi:hypothetical protein
MKNSEKFIGALFLIIGVVDLIRRDWLGAALLILAGAGLLIDTKKLGLPRGVEVALVVILFALLIVRAVLLFSR